MIRRETTRPDGMDSSDVFSFYYLRDVLDEGCPDVYAPYFGAVSDAHQAILSQKGIGALRNLVLRVGLDFVVESFRIFGSKKREDLGYKVSFGGDLYEPEDIASLYYRTYDLDLFRNAHLSVFERADFSPRQLSRDFLVKEEVLKDNWARLFGGTKYRDLFERFLEKELRPLDVLKIYYHKEDVLDVVERAHLKALEKWGKKVSLASRAYDLSARSFHYFLKERGREEVDLTGPPDEGEVLSLFYRVRGSERIVRKSLLALLLDKSVAETAQEIGVHARTLQRLLKKLGIRKKRLKFSEPTEI